MVNDVLASAMRMLAMREHSRYELQNKLLKRFDSDWVEQVLDQLAKDNLQSDQRFTEQYLDMRVRKGYGPLRIRNELAQKGIDDNLLEDQFMLLDMDWFAHLKSVRQSKFAVTSKLDQKEMGKQARFLEYRGFPAEMIARAVFNN